ncbi:hypothetical protein CEXT_53401 [Caerostris extrusa]|uniref:Uncharacterized protein n=1 Tax=Caerostris extrusa TaxID=172846 RepID=A0AAV4US31_CAEEX|nr:hypothetical protein CEXT_53401 [Caerostris extrusa]
MVIFKWKGCNNNKLYSNHPSSDKSATAPSVAFRRNIQLTYSLLPKRLYMLSKPAPCRVCLKVSGYIIKDGSLVYPSQSKHHLSQGCMGRPGQSQPHSGPKPSAYC